MNYICWKTVVNDLRALAWRCSCPILHTSTDTFPSDLHWLFTTYIVPQKENIPLSRFQTTPTNPFQCQSQLITENYHLILTDKQTQQQGFQGRRFWGWMCRGARPRKGTWWHCLRKTL